MKKRTKARRLYNWPKYSNTIKQGRSSSIGAYMALLLLLLLKDGKIWTKQYNNEES